ARVRGHEVVLPADGYPVTGIVEERKVGTGQLDAKLANGPLHGPLVEVEAVEQVKAEPPQGLGHVARVVPGVLELGRILVGGVADYQCDALLGVRRRRTQQGERKQPDDKAWHVLPARGDPRAFAGSCSTYGP